MKLPIYELKISENFTDDSEVSYVALVDEPAIKKDFLMFNENKIEAKFKVTNEDQHIISGPLMLADELIYRNNEKFGEHYVKFSADTIKQIAIKFAKKNYQSRVNLMHDEHQKVDGVTMFESFLVDKKRGIQAMAEFKDVPDGSWFGSFYVDNPQVWEQLKSGEFKGFSVEGLFDYEEPISQDMNELKRLKSILESDFSDELKLRMMSEKFATINNYNDYKKELTRIAKESNSESQFVDKVKSELKQYIPRFFADVRRDIFKIKDADWAKMMKFPSSYVNELGSVSLENTYNKLK